MGMEGVVAKRRSSLYRPASAQPRLDQGQGASRTQEVVIGGWTPGSGDRRSTFGALLLGLPVDREQRDADVRRARSAPASPTRPGRSCSASSSRSSRSPAPSTRRLPPSFEEGATWVSPTSSSARSASANGPPTGTSAIRCGEGSGPTSPSRTCAVSPEPIKTDRRRAGAHRLQSGQGPLPRHRIHQGADDRLLRPGRAGHAAPCLRPAPDHEAISRRSRPPSSSSRSTSRPMPRRGSVGSRCLRRRGRGRSTTRSSATSPRLVWAANLAAIEFHVPLWHVGRRRSLPAPPDHMVFDLDPGEGSTIVECCPVAARHLGDPRAAPLEGAGQDQRVQGPSALCAPRRSSDLGQGAHRRPRDRHPTGADHPDLVVSNMRKSLRTRQGPRSTGARTTRPRRRSPPTRCGRGRSPRSRRR